MASRYQWSSSFPASDCQSIGQGQSSHPAGPSLQTGISSALPLPGALTTADLEKKRLKSSAQAAVTFARSTSFSAKRAASGQEVTEKQCQTASWLRPDLGVKLSRCYTPAKAKWHRTAHIHITNLFQTEAPSNMLFQRLLAQAEQQPPPLSPPNLLYGNFLKTAPGSFMRVPVGIPLSEGDTSCYSQLPINRSYSALQRQ